MATESARHGPCELGTQCMSYQTQGPRWPLSLSRGNAISEAHCVASVVDAKLRYPGSVTDAVTRNPPRSPKPCQPPPPGVEPPKPPMTAKERWVDQAEEKVGGVRLPPRAGVSSPRLEVTLPQSVEVLVCEPVLSGKSRGVADLSVHHLGIEAVQKIPLKAGQCHHRQGPNSSLGVPIINQLPTGRIGTGLKWWHHSPNLITGDGGRAKLASTSVHAVHTLHKSSETG